LHADTKSHSRDPKPTVLDPNDPKAKQTYVPPSETFEEYMKRRAAQGKNQGVAVQAKQTVSSPSYSSYSSARKSGGKDYSVMYLRT
jgi:hypothetical protein